MDKNFMYGNCPTSTQTLLFNEIMLGRTEVYDTTRQNCWAFCKSTDVRGGITLSLGNLCGGYPFPFCGHIFRSSECAYLCGEFSLDAPLNKVIQQNLMDEPNAFVQKKVIKKANMEHVRQDWAEIRLQWMLYVVWCKCIGNSEFRELLLSVPSDAVIIEDSTNNHGATATLWGAKNKELKRCRWEKKKEVCAQHQGLKKNALKLLVSEECGKINNVGCFIGENNLGKILKMCQIALIHHVSPPIDYALLKEKKIYLLGKLLTFNE